MKLNNLTFVYFIEDYNQEKLLYLRYKDNSSLNLLFIYSNLKPKLFFKNFLFTDKHFFSDCLAEIFSQVNTDYFIYLKPEEDIPFIDDNQRFDQPYYFFEINYNFAGNKLVVSELRLYNRLKILKEGIENINTDQCYKPIAINNYHYFYKQIEESITKKHLSLIKKNIYREDSINYLTLKNIKLFDQKGLEANFLLNENVFVKIKENSENKLSSNYLYPCINLLLIYLKEKNYKKFTEYLLDLESLITSPTVTFIKAVYYKIIGQSQTAIEYFDKTMQLANSKYYRHIAFSKSWLDYYSIYQKAEVYKKSGQIEKAISQYEECLEISTSKEIIKEAKVFIENTEKIRETDFKCESCGNCCRSKLINITHNDVKNILENRPDLLIEDFIDFVQVNKEMKEFSHQDLFIADNQKNMMVLKKKSTKKECIFLGEENKCEVHLFKPLACKTWPFVIRESDKELMWSLHERDFIKNHCAHSFEENNHVDQIKYNIIEFKKDRSAFIEAIYYWNTANSDKNNKYDFVNYSLKLSNQEIAKLNNQINQKILDKFSSDKNISVIESKPFISQYFIETNNTFSYAIYPEDLDKFLNKEVFEQIKNLLKAESYLLLNQPETHISFFINSENKYTVNIFISPKNQQISISKNSEILYEDNSVFINTVNNQEMLNIKVNQLKNRFEYLLEFFKNNCNDQDIRKNIDTINTLIFSLIAWLNKENFEIARYNNFEHITEDFNQYLLSNNQNASNEKELKKLLENSYNVFSKYLKIFENITLI